MPRQPMASAVTTPTDDPISAPQPRDAGADAVDAIHPQRWAFVIQARTVVDAVSDHRSALSLQLLPSALHCGWTMPTASTNAGNPAPTHLRSPWVDLGPG
jgi:hypothetical protein